MVEAIIHLGRLECAESFTGSTLRAPSRTPLSDQEPETTRPQTLRGSVKATALRRRPVEDFVPARLSFVLNRDKIADTGDALGFWSQASLCMKRPVPMDEAGWRLV